MITQPKNNKNKLDTKFGTYLTYNRISKYEQNFETMLEERIKHLISNFQITDENLISQMKSNYNITEDQIKYHIDQVRNKIAFYKKRGSRQLKKIETLPTFKTPGVRVSIQGKKLQLYIFRMFGVRNEFQLNRIINFINILLYLYV